MVFNQLTFAPGSAGLIIDSISLLVYNSNPVDVNVLAVDVGLWLGETAGGGPASPLTQIGIEDLEFAANSQTTLTYTNFGSFFSVPNNLTLWMSINFIDSNNGNTGATEDQLNHLGFLAYHPATVGTDGSQAYVAPSSTLDMSNPTPVVEPLGTPYGANFGLTLIGNPPSPEPSSIVSLGLGITGIACACAAKRFRRLLFVRWGS